MSPNRGRAALVVCTLLATAIAATTAGPGVARAELLWVGDPSKAKNEVFKSTGSDGNCGEPSSLTPVRDTERGLVWQYQKPAESNRCENHGIKVDGKSFVFENNRTYYLGWWSKLSSAANNNANFQWKSYGEGHEQNFPVVLKMQGGEMTLMQRQPDNSETILWRKRIAAGEWNHFALALHLSSELRGGAIEFWFNGVQQRLIPGGTRYACRLFDSGNHNCPKWGVYGGRGSAMTNLTSEQRVGTTLADVAMRGSAPAPGPTPEPPGPNPSPPPPAPGALPFEAEDLEVINSGTGTSLQLDPMTSGGKWVALDAENAGSWMEFTLPNVPAGNYQLHITHKTNSNRGQLISRIDGVQVGETLDQYATDSSYPTTVMGSASLSRDGDRKVRMVAVGKQDSSQGFVLSADRLALVPTSEEVPRAREIDNPPPIEDVVGHGCNVSNVGNVNNTGSDGSLPWAALLGLGLMLLAFRRRRRLAVIEILALGAISTLGACGEILPGPFGTGGDDDPVLAALIVPPPPAPPPLPSIPNRTCNVRDHGAEGDGDANDTDAINEAIAACNSAGGGTVSFPGGTYLVASVRLRSNIRLLIQAGATIRGLDDGYDEPEANRFDEYQDFGHSHFRNAMLWGEGISNLVIEGPGRIDGDGLTDSDGPDSGQGDKQVSCKSCDRLLFRNLTQTKGGHFFYLLTDCRNVTIDNLSLTDGRDGINLVGCRNCQASNLRTRGLGDDAVPLKNDYSTGKRLTTENIYIHDSSFESGCNAIQVGSETAGDFRNVWFKNITVLKAGKAGIGLQTNDGGIVENFYIENITIKRAANPIYINSSERFRTPEKVSTGRVRNVFINNVTITEVEQTNNREPVNSATISGRPGAPHENITLSNVRITMPGGGSTSDGDRQPPYTPKDNYNPRSMGTRPAYGFFVRHVKNLSFQGVTVDFEESDQRPAWRVTDVDGLEFGGISAERAGSSAHPSLVLSNVRNFSMRGSPQFPNVQQASVPSASYNPSSNQALPVPPAPAPELQPTPPPSPPPPSDPVPPTPPTRVALTFEAEELPVIHSGTGTTLQTDAASSEGRWVSLDAENAGSWFEFTLPDVPAGTYTMKLRHKSNIDRGVAVVRVDGEPLGEPIDQYSSREAYPTATLGMVSFTTAGDHKIRIGAAGHNEASRGFLISADAFILE